MPSELAMRVAADVINAMDRREEEIESLRQQVAELRADSERYVELRDGESRFAVADYGDIREGCALVGGKLDEAIDAALKEPSRDA